MGCKDMHTSIICNSIFKSIYKFSFQSRQMQKCSAVGEALTFISLGNAECNRIPDLTSGKEHTPRI